MKKGLFYSIVALAAIFITSCDKSDDIWDLPESYTYATIREVSVDDKRSESSNFFFELDNGKTFIVDQNKSTSDYTTLEPGQRVVAGIRALDVSNELYDYSVILYDLATVITGESATVTTEEHNSQIANDVIEMISDKASLTNGYLNLFVGVETEDIENVKFYLVDNQIVDSIDEDEDEDKKYLQLELRFDNASTADSDDMDEYIKYVSFNMSMFAEKLNDLDGISLKVHLEEDEYLDMQIDSYKLFE